MVTVLAMLCTQRAPEIAIECAAEAVTDHGLGRAGFAARNVRTLSVVVGTGVRR